MTSLSLTQLIHFNYMHVSRCPFPGSYHGGDEESTVRMTSWSLTHLVRFNYMLDSQRQSPKSSDSQAGGGYRTNLFNEIPSIQKWCYSGGAAMAAAVRGRPTP